MGDNIARLPAHEDFVLTHPVNNVTSVWHIMYDGTRAVHLDKEEGWPFSGAHITVELCGVNCSKWISMGTLASNIQLSLRADGTVEVHWPWGWTYRPYRS